MKLIHRRKRSANYGRDTFLSELGKMGDYIVINTSFFGGKRASIRKIVLNLHNYIRTNAKF